MGSINGKLSVESENIFPIIKQWLYTEQDIFVRELISNCADAISKRDSLIKIGTCQNDAVNSFICIEINQTENTIKFMDNGIGMDADEIERYINQIAFSSAADFLNQYKDNVDNSLIGHFGLGFYSAFMVADKVEIDTLSCKPKSKPVHWTCDCEMNYKMEEGNKSEIGTTITLHVESDLQYLKPQRMGAVINKYFAFFPIPIELSCKDALADTAASPEKKQINDTNPLWVKNPEDCISEEYIAFYQKAFNTHTEPVLWLHLYNEELGIKGLVYFRNEDSFNQNIDGQIKIYSNQVYITDEGKGLLPEFLSLQNVIFDCTDLPLMASRSSVQKSEALNSITHYIVEQVAFKLYGTFECEREFYEEIWNSLNPFIKFSCLKDKLFASYVEKFIIFRTLRDKYVTLNEYLEQIKDKHQNIIYYVSDEIQQAHYISTFKKAGIDALYMTHVVDQPLIKKLEMKDTNLRFNRIDSDFCSALKEKLTEDEEAKVTEDEARLVNSFKGLVEDKHLTVKADRLITKEISSIMILDEEERRVKDAIEMYSATGIDVSKFSYGNDILLLNLNNKLVHFLLNPSASEKVTNIIKMQLIDIARLGQETLEAEQMSAFIDRSNMILELAIERDNA